MRRDILTLSVYLTDVPDSDMEPPKGYEPGADIMAVDIRLTGESLTERLQAFLIASQVMGGAAANLNEGITLARNESLNSIRTAFTDFLSDIIPDLPSADKPAVPLND